MTIVVDHTSKRGPFVSVTGVDCFRAKPGYYGGKYPPHYPVPTIHCPFITDGDWMFIHCLADDLKGLMKEVHKYIAKRQRLERKKRTR